MNNITCGDVVSLKESASYPANLPKPGFSGNMTVKTVDGDKTICTFFDEKNNLQNIEFNTKDLKVKGS